jgi:hypothetical protein
MEVNLKEFSQYILHGAKVIVYDTMTTFIFLVTLFVQHALIYK